MTGPACHRSCPIFALGLALIVLATLGHGRETHVDLETIKRSIIANERRFTDGVTIVARERSYADDGSLSEELEHTLRSRGDWFLLVCRATVATPGRPECSPEHFVGGPVNIYKLRKSGDCWTLRDVIPSTPEIRREVLRAEKGLSLPFAMFDVRLDRYFELEDLTVRRIARESLDGVSAHVVETHRTIKCGVDERFVFNPAWALLKHEIRYPSGARASVMVEYHPVTGWPTRWTRVSVSDGKSDVRFETVIDRYERERHPPEVFSLSQYGIPDPPEHQTVVVSRVVPSLIALMIGTALVSTLWGLRRRRQMADYSGGTRS